MTRGGAIQTPQYPISEEEVPEEAGDEEILSEQPLEERTREDIPRYCVCDGGELGKNNEGTIVRGAFHQQN
jgi:hypothetical protein